MASNPPGACCATGFKHEGTPVGETKNIGGGKQHHDTEFIIIQRLTLSLLRITVDTYISAPKDNKTPQKAVLILTDIFGLFVNSQLLADEFANNGYLAVMPDLFRGDAIKQGDMEAGKVSLPDWIQNHQVANVEPVIESTIKHIRQDLGVSRVSGVGYCFGGKVSGLFDAFREEERK